MKYRKKPVVIDACVWLKYGDHPAVRGYQYSRFNHKPEQKCQYCGQRMDAHGQVNTLEGHHIVCPGDYVITGVKGEYYPCKPDIFAATYDSIDAPVVENNETDVKMVELLSKVASDNGRLAELMAKVVKHTNEAVEIMTKMSNVSTQVVSGGEPIVEVIVKEQTADLEVPHHSV